VEPSKGPTPLASVCMSISAVLDATLAMGLIDQQDHDAISHAVWDVRRKHKAKLEAAE
jgi:hypothetical protein